MEESIRKSIEAFNNRTIYKSLDPTILESIADADVEQAVIDYVLTKLEGRHTKQAEVLMTIPQGARALYLTWIVEAEVNNGGLNQYFWNTNGEFATEAVDAFLFFSATQHAALMQEANQIRAKEARVMSAFEERGTLEAFSESYSLTQLGPLDTRFYSLKEDLSALRVAKIRSTPELFSGD